MLGSADKAALVQWPHGLWPSYEICAEQATALVGDDDKAVQAILCGAAPLRDMPKGGQSEKAAWARAEFDRKYGDLADEFGDPMESERARATESRW